MEEEKPTKQAPLLTISLLFLLSLVVIIIIFIQSPSKTLIPKSNPCVGPKTLTLAGERFLWYAPHSGFSNQLSELKNAIFTSAIPNRTLIVPPVLDHHAVALGSCPKFRVMSADELRTVVWDHIMELVNAQRYVSMADIVDLSSVTSSMVKIIDFRAFASL